MKSHVLLNKGSLLVWDKNTLGTVQCTVYKFAWGKSQQMSCVKFEANKLRGNDVLQIQLNNMETIIILFFSDAEDLYEGEHGTRLFGDLKHVPIADAYHVYIKLLHHRKDSLI